MAVGGCGSSARPPSHPVHAGVGLAAAPAAGAFAWLRASPPPAGWHTARIAGGATLAYPPGWHELRGDRGTVSAAVFDAHGGYLGYLNLTPRQGAETSADWARFRVRHNAGEGDRRVTPEGAATGLRFGAGRASCVRDAYSGSTGIRYVEIACLIASARASSVVVAAAPAVHWSAEQGVLKRAISAADAR